MRMTDRELHEIYQTQAGDTHHAALRAVYEAGMEAGRNQMVGATSATRPYSTKGIDPVMRASFATNSDGS